MELREILIEFSNGCSNTGIGPAIDCEFCLEDVVGIIERKFNVSKPSTDMTISVMDEESGQWKSFRVDSVLSITAV